MNHSAIRSFAARTALALALISSIALAGCSSRALSPVAPTSTAPSSSSQAPSSGTAVPTHATFGPAPAAGPNAPSMPGRLLPVPAPSGGTISEVIPKGTPGPVTKVGLEDTADLPGKVSIEILKVAAMETKATTPGEIAGPAVSLAVSIHNGSAGTINIDSVIVTLTDQKSGIGQPTTSDPYSPFAGELAKGASAEGVYVFLLPKDDRQGLTLTVEYAAGQASASFTGDVP